MLTSALNLTFLLFLSALFSGAETAYTKIPPSKAEVLRNKKGHLNKITLFLHDRLDIVITVNLILSNLANIMISAYITVIATTSFGTGKGLFIAVSLGTFLILVFGEIIPKKIAILFPIGFAKFSAYILYMFYYLLYPAIIPISHSLKWIDKIIYKGNDIKANISEEEVGAMLDLGKKEGALQSQEYEMIKNLMLLNDKEVQDIMVRRNDIVAIQEDATLKDLIKLVAESKLSRIPVYKDNISEIDGIIFIPKIIPYILDSNNLDRRIKDFNPHDALKVPESKILDDLFFEFQKKRVHMAIVLDEFGETSGLITLEDIVEEIFGNIEDETDKIEVKIRKHKNGELLCSGDVLLLEVLKNTQSRPGIQRRASLKQDAFLANLR
jgi:putative hemolysin